MAGASGTTNVSVSERLRREPFRFTFYQAVRLLMQQAQSEQDAAHATPHRRNGQLGTTSNLSDEPVRFRTHTSLGFAASEIVGLSEKQVDSADTDGSKGQPLEMTVSFWGLTGPAGALPNHYTQQVIDRIHNKDSAMRDFFDMFSHRQLSFFYRAWQKYSLAAGFENSRRGGEPGQDVIHEALLALVGRGTSLVRDRLESSDDANVYYGGLFVDRPTAESLQAMVADYLQLPCKVLSLFGQWLVLPIPERSRLGDVRGHCQMGVDTIMGGRTWDPCSKFRIQIGPVTWKQFEQLMPTGDTLVRVCQFIRSYVGLEFDFDLQVILLAGEIPACRFASRPGTMGTSMQGSMIDESATNDLIDKPDGPDPHLGWNTWLCSKRPTRDSQDAVFHHDGSPTR